MNRLPPQRKVLLPALRDCVNASQVYGDCDPFVSGLACSISLKIAWFTIVFLAATTEAVKLSLIRPIAGGSLHGKVTTEAAGSQGGAFAVAFGGAFAVAFGGAFGICTDRRSQLAMCLGLLVTTHNNGGSFLSKMGYR